MTRNEIIAKAKATLDAADPYLLWETAGPTMRAGLKAIADEIPDPVVEPSTWAWCFDCNGHGNHEGVIPVCTRCKGFGVVKPTSPQTPFDTQRDAEIAKFGKPCDVESTTT